MAAARPASSDNANIQMGIPMFIYHTDKGAKIGNFRESNDADYKSAGSSRSDCKSNRTSFFWKSDVVDNKDDHTEFFSMS